MTRQEFHWPPPVLPGEVVAVAAPASHVSRPPWEAGMNILRDWGFGVRCGPEVFEPRAYGVATDRLMARRFEEIWLDPEVKAVLAVRGGYGCLKLLPHLNLAALAAAPAAPPASSAAATVSRDSSTVRRAVRPLACSEEALPTALSVSTNSATGTGLPEAAYFGFAIFRTMSITGGTRPPRQQL